jgi:hypothetical protein
VEVVFKEAARLTIKNAVFTSKKAQDVSITDGNYLTLFREQISVFCQDHMKRKKYTLWAKY